MKLTWTSPVEGLPLRHATASGWSAVALGDLDALLVDHAHCEQKAAAAGLSLLGKFPDCAALLRPMIALAQEEIHHFRQVLDLIEQRGGRLTKPTADRYVRQLRQRGFQHAGGLGPLGDLLLVNGLIEARSCERFRLLAEGLGSGVGELNPADRDRLAEFYRRLSEAEGRHWELFRDLAAEVSPRAEVDRRLGQLADVEAEIVEALPFEPRMH